MSATPTYIKIVNDFWDKYSRQPLSAPATVVFFYILNLINRNRWAPVVLSDRAVADAANVSRGHIREYKKEMQNLGLLSISAYGSGRAALTSYQLVSIPPEMAPKKATNGTEKSQFPPEMAPKKATNGTEKSQLHLIDINKTIRPIDNVIDTATTASAAEETAEEKLQRLRRVAADQGAQVLKAFFAPTEQANLEKLCMFLRLDICQIRSIADEIVTYWASTGFCHNNSLGAFDIRDALRHLRLTLPKMAEARRRADAQAATPSRDQHRSDLINASLNGLQQAINGTISHGPDINPF